jgi:hypothetical protein
MLLYGMNTLIWVKYKPWKACNVSLDVQIGIQYSALLKGQKLFFAFDWLVIVILPSLKDILICIIQYFIFMSGDGEHSMIEYDKEL